MVGMKNIVALLADFANGIFALLLAAWYTETEILWWYVPIALVVAMLPDVDAIPELLTRGRVSASREHQSDHRTFLHYPVISLPLVTVLCAFGGFWGLLIGVAIILHLINDLYGTGWGLELLWPLSTRRYKFLGRRVNRTKAILVADGDWEKLDPAERRLRLVVSWSAAELPQYIVRWGVDDWIQRWYFSCNWISATEYSLFVVAATTLVFVMLQ